MLVVFVWGLASAPIGTSADATTDEATHRALFKQYCSACHFGAEPEGSFNLSSLSSEFSRTEDRNQWLRIAEQLKTGMMPPADEPRPEQAKVKQLLDWIDRQVVDAERTRKEKYGRAVMRRLNQTEYANTRSAIFCRSMSIWRECCRMIPLSVDLIRQLNRCTFLRINWPATWKLPIARWMPRLPTAQDHGSWLGDLIQRRKLSLAGRTFIVTSTMEWQFLHPTWHRIFRSSFGIVSRGFRASIDFAFRLMPTKPISPYLFHLNGGRENLGDPPYLIDYFEVPPGEPTVVEFVTEMEARRNIRLLVDTEIRPRDWSDRVARRTTKVRAWCCSGSR